MKCPKCRCPMKIAKIPESKSSDEEEFRCHKQKCRQSRSIMQNSFFASSKMPQQQIIMFIHFWAKMYPHHILEDDFYYSVPTIVDWSRFCRDLTVYYFEINMSTQIGGE
ncbi:hypothetical protein RF11_15682 [Thelohanellus kitauei]|uniref:Uncharacterized protein n=1 Tax=Thelohanellus kitauei TaxID=669202 RepID=A0A0C2N7I6_THEKT|nr:hypothetical protein RF11_15682 [Thelohanellus kitauei]